MESLPAAIRTEGLVKVYGQRSVVNGVNVHVQAGEIVGLLGPNGAGKTTTFYMIVGLVPATSGRVFINGQDATDLRMHRRARLGVGYLPQEASVFRKLTVEENVLAIVETLPVKSASVKTHSIFRDQLMLMVSPQNALAKLDVVPVSEVAKQPLLLPKTGYSRRVMDKLFRPYAAHLQIRMELPSVGMIKSFVAAGLGVSLISSSFAKDQVLAGRVKLIPIRDQELWRELGIAYRRDRTHTRATTTFISTVRQLATASK